MADPIWRLHLPGYDTDFDTEEEAVAFIDQIMADAAQRRTLHFTNPNGLSQVWLRPEGFSLTLSYMPEGV